MRPGDPLYEHLSDREKVVILRELMDERVAEIKRAREYEFFSKEDEILADLFIEYKTLKGD